MLTSICIATRNKSEYLARTLASINGQSIPFDYEVIVVDDGSTDATRAVCKMFDVNYIWLDNNRYRNPSVARNVAYRAARGEVIINQSDEIIHKTNCVQQLTNGLKEGEILFAHVLNVSLDGLSVSYPVYCGPENPRPLFFLGSLWRRDMYAIGGNSEDFVEPCYDDDWLAQCLINGLGLVPRYAEDIIGWHVAHGYVENAFSRMENSKTIYDKKCAARVFTNTPWEYK